jgi:formylglycine-generating enzyme required for sulfatase activity
MGSAEGENGRRGDEKSHLVTVSSFLMGVYEVTQAEYEAVMGGNPSHFKGDSLPVQRVSWCDAIKFCNKLSEKEGLSPAYTVDGQKVIWDKSASGYRLPTEAEWEYACRAGSTEAALGSGAETSNAAHSAAYNTGSFITITQANYYGRKPLPVGTFAPNSFGLCDMHGNVWEWCWDGYGGYTKEADNPANEPGYVCVVRGGSYRNTALDVRSAVRGSNTATYRSWDTGFRVARNAAAPDAVERSAGDQD